MAPFTASRRVLPGGRRAAPASPFVNVSPCSVRAGFARSISSCMLDDRPSPTTISRPRDWISDSEYGRTGSISAHAVNTSAATSVRNGSRRRIDARLERSIQRIVAAAANLRRPRQRRSTIATNAASSHHASCGWRKRISANPEHLLRLRARVAASVRRAGAVARVPDLLAGAEDRSNEVDELRVAARPARRENRPHFGGGQAVDRNAARVAQVRAYERVDAIVGFAAVGLVS